jgi:hypothetical protein
VGCPASTKRQGSSLYNSPFSLIDHNVNSWYITQGQGGDVEHFSNVRSREMRLPKDEVDLLSKQTSIYLQAIVVIGIIALIALAEFGSDWIALIDRLPPVWPRLH